jgi:outer membrane protein assembly factor BamB
VTSIVTDGERVFISGGYPKNHVAAVEADGSGKVVWNNISRVYVPSMLVVDGHLYAVMDGGSAMCWDSKTGERKWKGVLGGTFTSSPVLVGDDIHVINENGEYSVFKANPAKFERIHKGALGEQVFATPVICGGRFYARVVESVNNERVEKLYCLGAK